MKFEDTVMTTPELWAVDKLIPDCPAEEKEDTWWCERHYLKAQAEISFKAGQREEYKKWIKACMGVGMCISKPEQLESLYRAGMKEMMEWLEKHPYYKKMFEGSPFEWQAKLKEWGL